MKSLYMPRTSLLTAYPEPPLFITLMGLQTSMDQFERLWTSSFITRITWSGLPFMSPHSVEYLLSWDILGSHVIILRLTGLVETLSCLAVHLIVGSDTFRHRERD